MLNLKVAKILKNQQVNEKSNYIYSIILKVKHVEQSDHQYEFFDINHDTVPLDYKNIINSIEGQKTYIFNSFKFKSELNESCTLVPLKFSSVIPIEDNNLIYKNIIISEDNISSFKGEVSNFNIATKEIEIITDNSQKLKLKLNNRLFKKISFGCLHTFKCFKKINLKIFLYRLNFQI